MAPASIVIDPNVAEDEKRPAPRSELVSWVMGYVQSWRTDIDSNFKPLWDEWYDIWRGKWTPDKKSRRKERSKLISPASQIAVDLMVAEMVEAVFSREYFFDLPEDVKEQVESAKASGDPEQLAQAQAQEKDAQIIRRQLAEDLYKDGIIRTIIEIIVNGALYGQFIAKIVVDTEEKPVPFIKQNEDGTTEFSRRLEEKVTIKPIPVEPGQLVVDTSAKSVDQMLGVAHQYVEPMHRIAKKMADGTYYNVPTMLGPSALPEEGTSERTEEPTRPSSYNGVNVTEWHGLVPKKLLAKARARQNDDLAQAQADSIDNFDMVEAIVTIADGSTLLRAIPNPAVMDDRAIVAEQFDTVPNRFWGRGLMEKGQHPQKAMDAEMRSRIDSLAWVGNPMLAGDLTKLPPKMDLNVWPGKFWGTRGNPAEALQEFRFGDINASTFQQTAELQAMHQQAVGAFDPSTIRSNIRDESAAGAGIAVSGMSKRSRRTMLHLESFMTTLIRRVLWRKLQFEPERYGSDYEFQVKGTLGIMAREVEQQFMVNLLQFADKDTPAYLVILKAIFETSTSPAKNEAIRAIEAMMQPPSQEEQQKQQALEQAQMQSVIEEVRNRRADTALKLAQGDKAKAEALLKQIEADFKDDELMLDNLRLIIDQREVQNSEEQNAISREKNEIQREQLRQRSAQQQR